MSLDLCGPYNLTSVKENISPGGGHGNPFQYSCLENPRGQRSLVGYSPWCHKESDMTEQLSTAQHSTTEITHSTSLMVSEVLR